MPKEHSLSSTSFCYSEVKKLGCCSLFLLLIIESTLYIVFNKPSYPKAEVIKTIYNLSSSHSDVFDIYGDIRIHSKSSTIFAASSSQIGNMSASWITRPYARKQDNMKFEPLREWTIHVPPTDNQFPACSNRRFNTPAVLFSAGGFAPNYFHSFSDVLIPLYSTTLHFNGEVVFLVSHYRTLWVTKFRAILQSLSKYDIIDVDNRNEILCFSRLIVGLKSSKEFGIDPMVGRHYSIKHFRQFLRKTYSLKRETVNYCQGRNPRMLIVSRKKTRKMINEDEVAKMAGRVGFDVVVAETGWNLGSVAQMVNSADVLMGVHGAGLSNMVFLPENATVIEIVPFGLVEASNTFFLLPGKDMKFRYLDYKVKVEESSLYGKYPPDSEIYVDPSPFHRKGWRYSKMYFDQDVTIDLARFRLTLLKAVEVFSC